MQHMLHSRTYMIVARCKKYLGLMLKTSERRAVDDGSRVSVISTPDILNPLDHALLHFLFAQTIFQNRSLRHSDLLP